MAFTDADGTDFAVQLVAAPVREQVVQRLEEAITTGRLKPGQRLVEKDLCERLGVSRPPMREALRHLESIGLVQSQPKRGPIVALLSIDDVENIYQLRGALEALAAKLFALKASDAQVAELRASVKALRTAMKGNDVAKVLTAKDQFYSILLAGSGNAMIETTLRPLKARIRTLRSLSLSSPTRAPDTLQEIEDILAAIEKRDADTAFRLSWEHIERATATAKASLEANLAAERE